MKKKIKTDCSPAIYREFTDGEKKAWEVLYKTFNYEVEQCLSSVLITELEKKKFKIFAHNIACMVVWSFKEIGNVINKKGK